MRAMTQKRIEALESKGAGADVVRLLVVKYVKAPDYDFVGPQRSASR